ncbi:bifunctional DNA primase/polymerase [Singulisphaera sp. PoT]|uniref:bifunctional DNA primase/polymerase n=1 Tax=Singulisphaera sp. PoT TaxID=3411797 RepID=UPI003BF5B03E
MRTAQLAALHYKSLGWNPLPSSRTDRHPVLRYTKYWDAPVDPWILKSWDRWQVANVQLMCGVRWDLAVVDLDGETASDAWQSLGVYYDQPRTWTVRTGGGGWHLYYRIPSGIAELPKACLWDLGGDHSKIELLGDGALVIAPPSRHWRTGRLYEFVIGPRQMDRPAFLPRWVIGRAQAVREKPKAAFPPPPLPPPRSEFVGHFNFRDVVRAIPDKAPIASSWGLRFTGRRSGKDWLECHAVGRDDHRPSAGFSPASGYYSEPYVRHMDFFDLGVALGRYATWQDCCNDLGRQYIGRSA